MSVISCKTITGSRLKSCSLSNWGDAEGSPLRPPGTSFNEAGSGGSIAMSC